MSDTALFDHLPIPTSGGLALARKWRPKDFKTLVGQDHVVTALSHALDQNRLHHAWLFTGTRGVGKTTIARILAKSLNCTGLLDHPLSAPTSTPCGQCVACQEIDAGRFVDYVEMDAASNRGIADMLSLLEKAVYGPTSGRYKVFMIDEVHMLTNFAFNAMLKTLEEPPAHMKFILATTDPQKIPVTVLSRCLQFNLKQMPSPLIVSHLQNILKEEAVFAAQNALKIIAKAARGSMRDALSLTDQAIAFASGQITEEAVRQMLGSLDDAYLVRILDAIHHRNGQELLAVSQEMGLMSMSFSIALQDLASILQKIAMAQVIPGSILPEWPEAEAVERLAGQFSKEEVQLYYQIAITSRADLGLAPEEEVGFMMCLLRMLAFQIDDGQPPLGPVARPHSGSKPSSDQSVVRGSEHVPAAVKSEELLSEPHLDQKQSSTELGELLVEPKDWQVLVKKLRLKGLVEQAALQTALISWVDRGQAIQVKLSSSVPQMATPVVLQKLSEALQVELGKAVHILLETQSQNLEHTVAKLDAKDQEIAQLQIERELDVDPFLEQLKKELGVKVVAGSIRSVLSSNP